MSQPDKKTAGKRPKKITRRRQNKKSPKSCKSNSPQSNNPVPSPDSQEIINPTPVNSTEINQLVPVDQKSNQDENNESKEVSIWEMKNFPNNTNKYKFTPQQVKNALEEYQECTTSIDKVLEKHNVRVKSFFALIGQYDEICQLYYNARTLKARAYGNESLSLWDKLPENKEFYKYDDEGNRELTPAAVNYLRAKDTNRLRHAQICETGSFIPLSRQEVQSRNVHLGINVNVSVSDDFDLDSSSPDDLLDVIKKTKRADV